MLITLERQSRRGVMWLLPAVVRACGRAPAGRYRFSVRPGTGSGASATAWSLIVEDF